LPASKSPYPVSQGLRVAKKRTPSHNLMGWHIQGRIAYNSKATSEELLICGHRKPT
jgi:hypothetical protein